MCYDNRKVNMTENRIRTIITQDAEVDDQNSLRHFLFYTNEVELQGIVQTSSKFHWIGVPGAVNPDETVHVIVKAQADGHHRLTYYQQVIITVD